MRASADGSPVRVAWIGDKGFPGIVRDVCAGPDGMLYLTTTVGGVASFHPQTHGGEALASGLDRLACMFSARCCDRGRNRNRPRR